MFQKLIAILLILFPSFIQVPLRRLAGQKIGKNSKIKFGSLIFADIVEIGQCSSIGPFSFVKCQHLKIGNHTSIKALSMVLTRVIQLDNYVQISPLTMVTSDFNEQSILSIGDHSRTFPFCWMEPGEGIFIGKNVSVGGHTLLFTHGAWSNYLEGGPISYGPIYIEDNVWLPWRVSVFANVRIGANSVVSGGSIVSKSFPTNSLIAGNPARLIAEDYIRETDFDEKKERLNEIFNHFSKHILFQDKIELQSTQNGLSCDLFNLKVDSKEDLKNGDLLFLLKENLTTDLIKSCESQQISILDYQSKSIYVHSNNKLIQTFISFIRRYGIRLYVSKK